MRTIRTKVYKFDELSKDAQKKAIEWFRNTDNSSNYEWAWENVKDDAEQVGLKLIELNDHRPNVGEFIKDADYCAGEIIENHGDACETYKTAAKYLDDRSKLDIDEQEDELEELDTDFLQSILEDYRIMYNEDIDHQDTDEFITEQLIANEYEFTKDGNRF